MASSNTISGALAGFNVAIQRSGIQFAACIPVRQVSPLLTLMENGTTMPRAINNQSPPHDPQKSEGDWINDG